MNVFRIVPLSIWEEANEFIPLSPIDIKDGFVHLSARETVLNTANLYFSPDQALVVLCFEEGSFGDALRWEVVKERGGARFPHLYAPALLRKDVMDVITLIPRENGFVWGESIN